MEVISVQRKAPVLTPSKLPCLAQIPTINLTAGCAHGCLYCYAQGYGCYPGSGTILWYENLLEKLREELGKKRKRPAAVYFSPSSDLFQPLPEVRDMAYRVLELLFQSGIGVVFLTKGRIPKRHLELLTRYAPLVQAQVGLVTVDRNVTHVFEPGAASPAVRLKQAQQLVAAGIATQVRIDPILPGLTDSPDMFHRLCTALAEVGIKEVSASTLFCVRRLSAHCGIGCPARRPSGGCWRPMRRPSGCGCTKAKRQSLQCQRRGVRRSTIGLPRSVGSTASLCACVPARIQTWRPERVT